MNFILGDESVTAQAKTLRSTLVGLFYFHMLLLFFQVPIRDIVLDITAWRDLGVIVICLIWAIYIVVEGKNLIKSLGVMDKAILLLLGYGLVNLAINIWTRSSVIDALLYFRNHFLPFLLYFPAAYAFKNTKDQKRFLRFLLIIFVIYISTPIFEALIKTSGFSLSWIPWYHYAFRHGDRFEASDGGYIETTESPILGMLGFPHYTVVPIVAIFALLYPFLFSPKNKTQINRMDNSGAFILISSSTLKFFWMMLLLICIMLFQVRTHIISIFTVLFIFAPPQLKKAKYLISLAVLSPLIYLMVTLISGTTNIFEQFVSGFTSSEGRETSLSVILSLNDVLFVVNSPLYNLLFGHGYDVIAGTDFDLIANSKGWEIKLVYYTGVYGFFWLILFLSLCRTSFLCSKKSRQAFQKNSFEYNFARGYSAMLIVLLIDACHYMRMVTWPTIDLWIICMGILAVNHQKMTSAERPQVFNMLNS